MEEVLPIANGTVAASFAELPAAGFAASGCLPASPRSIHRSRLIYALTATGFVVAGSLALLPLWTFSFHLWASDPLRSIGAIFPLLALLGVLARWRDLDWQPDGTPWALALVLLAIPLARFASASYLDLTVRGETFGLLHLGPTLFLYGVGATLLFGGPRLLRAALAPLCLLLAINPVPHAFNSVADMPLQQLSAATARGFAHSIGLEPTGEQLRMMFAPHFGMLIVPGCNGVRGSVTLAYLTLIFAYTRRLRPSRIAVAALSALLLGYALNLLRLCLLVVYYRVGLSVTAIQKYGVEVDYVIGCSLFLLATMAIGLAVRAFEPPPTARQIPSTDEPAPVSAAALARGLCFLALTMFFALPQLHALASVSALRPNEQEVLRLFPASVGPFRLVRSYAEHDGNGTIVMGLGEYRVEPLNPDGSARRLTFGLWVASADHLVADSRLVQGVGASWTGAFDAGTRAGLPVHFATSAYDDGVTRVLDADAACSTTGCSDSIAGGRSWGFLLAGPRLRDLAVPPTGRRLPILLEREWPESDATPFSERRTQFEDDARLFTHELDLLPLIEHAGSRP